MMNEELDEQTLRLLTLVCDGVEVATDEEAEEAKQQQGGIHIVDDSPINGLAWAADLDKEQRARLF